MPRCRAGWAPGTAADGFDAAAHPLVAELHRRAPWLRLGRTGCTWDALVAAVLEQKVTGIEAHRTWRELLRLAGEPAPGPAPAGMRVVPSARRRAGGHRLAVAPLRPGRRPPPALRAVASVAARLEPDDGCDSPTLQRRLRTVPGIGIWTAAEVAQRTLGCPDSVSYGDYHTKNLVGWSLAGRKTDDDGMMALLEPWRGHRQRVVRLLGVGGSMPPKRGPGWPPRTTAPSERVSRGGGAQPQAPDERLPPAVTAGSQRVAQPPACSCTIAAASTAPRFSAVVVVTASVRWTSTTPSSSPP